MRVQMATVAQKARQIWHLASASPQGASVSAYFLSTWRTLILVSTSLSLLAATVRPTIAIATGLLSIMVLLRVTPFTRRRYLTFGVLACDIGLVARAIANFLAHRDLIVAVAELLSCALPLLLLRKDRPARHWLSFLTTTFLASAALLVRNDTLVYLVFLVDLAIMVFNMNAATMYFLVRGERNVTLPRRYFVQFFTALPPALVVGLLVFFAFPRLRGLNYDFGLGGRAGRVGYTGLVNLSGGGNLLEDDSIAMRVDTQDHAWLADNGPNLYFRGNTLDHFNGVQWTNTEPKLGLWGELKDARITTAHTSSMRHLTVYLEPMATVALFYPEVLRRLTVPSRLTGPVTVDAAGGLSRENYRPMRFSYELDVSRPLEPRELDQLTVAQMRRRLEPEPTRQPWRLSPDGLRRYLEVPESLQKAPYFRDWSRDLALATKERSIKHILLYLQRYFQENFHYTLSNEFSLNRPFEAFLTTDKRGHCEYFATAAALFLRTLGIPTRLVAGYHGGYFNLMSHLLDVPQRNAHVWVEIYTVDNGWISFDPTPFALSSDVDGVGAMFKVLVNALNFWFNHYVIDYDLHTQAQLLQKLTGSIPALHIPAVAGLKSLFQDLGLVLVPALLLFLGWRRMRRRRAQGSLPEYYALFARRLKASGFERADTESYRAFHARLVALGFEGEFIAAIDEALDRDLYAPVGTNTLQGAQLKRQAAKLRFPDRGERALRFHR